MDADILKIVGQVAGIGGVAMGVFLLLFRDIIRKNIFPRLTEPQGYKLLFLMSILIWSLAITGIIAWLYTQKIATTEKTVSTVLSINGKVLDGITDDPIAGARVDLVGYLEKSVVTTDDGVFYFGNLSAKPGDKIQIQVSKDNDIVYKRYNGLIHDPSSEFIIKLTRN